MMTSTSQTTQETALTGIDIDKDPRGIDVNKADLKEPMPKEIDMTNRDPTMMNEYLKVSYWFGDFLDDQLVSLCRQTFQTFKY